MDKFKRTDKEIKAKLSEEYNVSKTEVDKAIKSLFDCITHNMMQGPAVYKIPNFGKFSPTDHNIVPCCDTEYGYSYADFKTSEGIKQCNKCGKKYVHISKKKYDKLEKKREDLKNKVKNGK